MSRTVNASGSHAALWMAGRNGPSSIKPRAGAAFVANASSLTQHRRGHLLGNDSPKLRRSSIIAVPSCALICWGRLFILRSPKHAPKTDSRSRATAASSRNRLVLGGPSLRARARRVSLSRRRAVVLLPFGRGRQARVVVLQRRHAGCPAADDPAGLDRGPGRVAGPCSERPWVSLDAGPLRAALRRAPQL